MPAHTPRAISIRPMLERDYAAAFALWRGTPGIGLSAADEEAAIHRYLDRNPGLSQTAWRGPDLVGAVLAGHDGRRGYLHHLCVREELRGQGIGRNLVDRALHALAAQGLDKVHAFLFTDNAQGRRFWERIGWTWRTEIGVISVTPAP